MTGFVDYDPDHVGCCIEPVFVEEVVGFYDYAITADPVVAVWQDDTSSPVMMSFHREVLAMPVPRTDVVLKWRPIDGAS